MQVYTQVHQPNARGVQALRIPDLLQGRISMLGSEVKGYVDEIQEEPLIWHENGLAVEFVLFVLLLYFKIHDKNIFFLILFAVPGILSTVVKTSLYNCNILDLTKIVCAFKFLKNHFPLLHRTLLLSRNYTTKSMLHLWHVGIHNKQTYKHYSKMNGALSADKSSSRIFIVIFLHLPRSRYFYIMIWYWSFALCVTWQ